MPFQPLNILPYSIGAADIAVVTTDAKQSGLSVPSKTYTYMSAGAALLCIADKETELGRLTEKYNIGKCYQSHCLNEISDYIKHLATNDDLLNTYKKIPEKHHSCTLLITQSNMYYEYKNTIALNLKNIVGKKPEESWLRFMPMISEVFA